MTNDKIVLSSSILKRSKQTLVPAVIVNSFSSFQRLRIALIHCFPLRGERWEIYIPSLRIQKHSNS